MRTCTTRRTCAGTTSQGGHADGESAKGIDDLTVKVRRDGSVRLRTVGQHVQFRIPQQNSLQVTVDFYNAAAGTAARPRPAPSAPAARVG